MGGSVLLDRGGPPSLQELTSPQKYAMVYLHLIRLPQHVFFWGIKVFAGLLFVI